MGVDYQHIRLICSLNAAPTCVLLLNIPRWRWDNCKITTRIVKVPQANKGLPRVPDKIIIFCLIVTLFSLYSSLQRKVNSSEEKRLHRITQFERQKMCRPCCVDHLLYIIARRMTKLAKFNLEQIH